MTDANELRAAAERCAANKPPECDHIINAHGQCQWCKWDRKELDAYAVASAYRAEHPADDAEPVTEEWLRSVGFRQLHLTFAVALVHHDEDADIRFRLRCEDLPNVATGCEWSLESLGPDGEESTLLPCRPTTRGAVRRLVEALGMKGPA